MLAQSARRRECHPSTLERWRSSRALGMARHWPRGDEPALWPVAFGPRSSRATPPNTRYAVCEATARRAQSGSSRLNYPSRAFSPARSPGGQSTSGACRCARLRCGVPALLAIRAIECPVLCAPGRPACAFGSLPACDPCRLRAVRKVRSQLSASACPSRCQCERPSGGPPASHPITPAVARPHSSTRPATEHPVRVSPSTARQQRCEAV